MGVKPAHANKAKRSSLKFESVGVDSLFSVLDAIAWVDQPTQKTITQFAGVDARTTGKDLKNCTTIGTIESLGGMLCVKLPYPYKGSREQKQAVVKESLLKMPLTVPIRQLASDLAKDGIDTWLDEHRILVGDSITEKIGQGLAQSDYFIIALSESSVSSAWVKKELSGALLREVERRKVTVLPIKLSE